ICCARRCRSVRCGATFSPSRRRWRSRNSSHLPRHQDRAGGDQCDAKPVGRAQPRAQEQRAEYRDQNHAQLVDRRHLGGMAELEPAKIANPRRTGCQPGQDEKRIGPAADRTRLSELSGRRRMSASVNRMTMVRMKVAKSALTFSTPILAKMAVNAAKTAERTAHSCQEETASPIYGSLK